MTNNAEEYIDQVLNKKILVGKYVRLAVERHVNDLKRTDIYFDRKAGDRAIQFFGFLKHTKGRVFAGKDFELSGWQAFIIYSLFGWKNLNGDRRFRLSYTEVAKKNGKSTLAAGIGLYMMIADKEPGAEVYSCATNRDQAKIVFNEARNMVKVSPDLSGLVTVFAHNIHIESTFSKFEALSADSDSFEGKNPYCGIIDEFHAHKDDLLFNNVKAATVARSQSLIWIITTAGFNRESPCYHFRKMCVDVLEGRLTDDGLFTIIFALDEGDDWHDKSLWVKSNPNLNISVLLPALESEFQQAINSTTAEVGFKTKNLNMWIDSGNIWIPDDKFKKCNSDYPALDHMTCYGSLDLSSTTDITVFGLLFKTDKFHWMPFFFLPDMTMIERVRRDHVNYDRWIHEGWITITGGDVVDYEFIRAFINEKAKQYKIKSIQYDRWNSSQLVTGLMTDGANMVPFGQGYQSMSSPTKELEKLVLGEEINFGHNPVMRWMNGNIEIRTDPAGNIKIDKSRSIEKVDGMVALAMALGGYMTDTNKGSIYDKRGIISI
jgi:phage terminase large subunit-like protein